MSESQEPFISCRNAEVPVRALAEEQHRFHERSLLIHLAQPGERGVRA